MKGTEGGRRGMCARKGEKKKKKVEFPDRDVSEFFYRLESKMTNGLGSADHIEASPLGDEGARGKALHQRYLL
ncbi:hypothetical protein CesoFtcFv8_022775 [Champsocephalus esox]|uniref:Uncharacterized protein n=1 Tax=Champsocephalus esox TaxID=159716 RepID=A0AAN8B6V9_9TELE|nr:hypothetical protein CesoFtcFv8_022775 [Champsocephalus esox]